MEIVRAWLAYIVSFAVLFQATMPSIEAQQRPNGPKPQVSVGELRQRLYGSLKPSPLGAAEPADFVIPWVVMGELVRLQMRNGEIKSTRQILLKNTTFGLPTNADVFLKDIGTRIREIQSQQLQSVGLGAALASDTDLGPQNGLMYQFASALQTASTAKFVQVKDFERGLAPIKAAAISIVRLPNVTQDALDQVQTANKLLQTVLSQNQLREEELSKLETSRDTILSCLSEQARTILGPVPPGIAATREYYQKLSGLASTLNGPTAALNSKVKKLTADGSIDLLVSLGHLDQSQQNFVKGIADSASQLQSSLNAGVGQLNGGWDKLLSSALNAPIANGVLPEQVMRLAPFVRDFDSLKELLGKGTPPSPSDISGVLFATGVISKDSGLGQATTAVNSIMHLKGDFGSSATAVLDAVNQLSKSGVPIPGLKEAAPLLSTASSIVQAAGPLLALTGFGGGFAAFQALGGFGGSNDNSAQFAKIQQALSQINAKLDQVLDKLDTLDKKITAQHEQVMNALEALGFDVERTRDLLINSVVHQKVRGPCRSAADPGDGNLRLQHINECNDELQKLYLAADIPGALTLKANLVTESLDKSALEKFRMELTIRQMLVSTATGIDCDGLVYPSPDIDNLNRKLSRYSDSRTPTSCSLLVLGAPLLEPGILEEYITDEQNALNSTAGLGKDQAMSWWATNGAQVRTRWTNRELPILEQAVAQQAIVSGDLLIPTFSKFLDDGSAPEKLAQVWNQRGVFAENVVRYWIWSRMSNETWIRTLYSVAWNSESDAYWYRLFCPGDAASCAIQKTVHFTRKSAKTAMENGTEVDEPAWFVTFGNLPEVIMPKPSEMYTLQLRWPVTLTRIVQTRNQLLSTVGGMQLVRQLWQTNNEDQIKDTLEAVAVTTSH